MTELVAVPPTREQIDQRLLQAVKNCVDLGRSECGWVPTEEISTRYTTMAQPFPFGSLFGLSRLCLDGKLESRNGDRGKEYRLTNAGRRAIAART